MCGRLLVTIQLRIAWWNATIAKLKAAICAYTDQHRWSEYLLIVLLGCCSAVMEELGYSSVELIYRSTVILTRSGAGHSGLFLSRSYSLHQQTLFRIYQSPTNDLLATDYYIFSPKGFCFMDPPPVFLHIDSMQSLLSPLYTGPYIVLSNSDKLYTININGKKKIISNDLVK